MIFLPIKPKYAFAIHSGEKKVEFRKVTFSREERFCIVYASSPVKRIIGYFELTNIEKGSPKKIWKKYRDVGCISEKDFFAYYSNSEMAVAIEIKDYTPLKSEVDPRLKLENFKVPQSFRYLKTHEVKNLMMVPSC